MNFYKFFYKVISVTFFGFLLFFLISQGNLVKAHYWEGYSPLDHPEPIVALNYPCDEIGDPEFHSLRPYQAGPCGDSPKASYCWNNYKIVEGLHTTWSLSCIDFGSYYQCPVNEEIEKVYTIDGELARFPIMGNTEWVTNSQNSSDLFTDAQKVNEYVGWYLNGIIGRPEYSPLNLNKAKSLDRIINTSGPINRLSPLALTQNLRINTIEQASDTLSHNQIVVCTNSLNNPIACYSGDGSPARGTVYRLKDWEGNLSWFNTVSRLYGYLLSLLTSILPSVPQNLLDEIYTSLYIDHWNSRKPPMPWGEDLMGEEMTALKYQKYYREWNGETCAMATILGVTTIHCFENWLVPNKYADLYPYVPLANTSDKDAEHLFEDENIHMEPNTGTIAYYQEPPDNDPVANPPHTGTDNPDKIHAPVLYYPHTQQTYDLSEYLNSMFTPTENGSAGSGFSTAADYEMNGCEIVDVRSNDGDYLFPSSDDSRYDDITAYVDVQVDAIGCPAGPINEWREACDDSTHSDCELASCCANDPVVDPLCTCTVCGEYPDICTEWPSCDGDVTFVLETTPQIPYATEIWQSTVVGPESTFRKIFPKIEEGAPVDCIADIPGVSLVQYAPLPNVDYTPLESVETPVSENPITGGVVNSQLYFPYQGTVYEYFLRGIQTALKPLGYGHPIPQGENCTAQETGLCKMWLFEQDPGGTFYYEKVIDAALSTTCNGSPLNPFWAIAIALNENGGLLSDNIQGDSNTHFGCRISQVETIEDKISCMTNTLSSYCSQGLSTEAILQIYGYPAGYSMWPLSVLMGGTSNPPYPSLFGSSYDVDQLEFNLLNTDWVAAYESVVPTFCPNSPVLQPPTALQ